MSNKKKPKDNVTEILFWLSVAAIILTYFVFLR